MTKTALTLIVCLGFSVSACGIAIIDSESTVNTPGEGGGGSGDEGGGGSTSSTTTPSDTGSGGSGGGCMPGLRIESIANNDQVVEEGWNDIPTRTIELTSLCGNLDVTQLRYEIMTPDADEEDSTPFCESPCTAPDDFNFYNLRAQTPANVTLMGPVELKALAANQHAVAEFADPFLIEEGVPTKVTLRLNIRTPLPAPAAHGKRFQAFLLGAVTEPQAYLDVVIPGQADEDAYITVQ